MSSIGSLSTGEIIGVAVGGVLALISIIGILYTICTTCCKKESSPQVEPYPRRNREPYPPYGQEPYPQYDQPYPPYDQGPSAYAEPMNPNYYPPQHGRLPTQARYGPQGPLQGPPQRWAPPPPGYAQKAAY